VASGVAPRSGGSHRPRPMRAALGRLPSASTPTAAAAPPVGGRRRRPCWLPPAVGSTASGQVGGRAGVGARLVPIGGGTGDGRYPQPPYRRATPATALPAGACPGGAPSLDCSHCTFGAPCPTGQRIRNRFEIGDRTESSPDQSIRSTHPIAHPCSRRRPEQVSVRESQWSAVL